MNQEAMTGMILSAAPVGEFDKRLVILTRERGKIAAFAKGARRPQSALLACSQPFVYADFMIYAGRTSYTVSSAEVHNYFGELRENLSGACYGCYACEVIDYLTRENMETIEYLKLLYQTLRIFGKQTMPYALVRAAFELRALALNGEAPYVFSCVRCGKEEEGMEFYPQEGGLLCSGCKRVSGKGPALRLSEAALYALRFMSAAPIEKLYTFTVSDDVLQEIQCAVGEAMRCLIRHEFKSGEMLELL